MRVYFNRTVLVISLLVYLSVFVPPSSIWWTGFVSLAIPFVIVFNFFLLVYYITISKRVLLYPLVSLLIAFPFIKATVAINPNASPNNHDFTILSYNTRFFKDIKTQNYGKFSAEMMHWVLNDSADIKCFQEFYSHPSFPNLDMLNRLKANGYQSHYLDLTPEMRTLHGLAIYSKFPIVNKGNLYFNDHTFNGAMYVDVLIAKDTIRVYNIHLRSMGLNSNEIMSPEIKDKYKDIAQSLQAGFAARARQINQLSEHIDKCPHPAIVCGDLNDMPYSYTYFKLRRKMRNTFEASGIGLGFTFNGKIPFLRIDNQFFDEFFEADFFNVEYDAEHSDHFPIKGYYSIR